MSNSDFVAAESSARAVLVRLAELGVVPSGVTDDSRQVAVGDLFLAYPGDLADGRSHIAAAIAAGACAVLWESSAAATADFVWNADWRIANLPVQALRALCGPLAHAVYGRPSERLSLIAVTGTNGKTSVTQWLAACHPRSCALIGTLGAGFPGRLAETGFTTPEATTLMRSLARFADDDAQACALEASSIGIAEGRLDGARVDVAVFTNLTHDHLDYHGTFAAYAEAKARLFSWPRLRLAVCNLDDPFGRELAALGHQGDRLHAAGGVRWSAGNGACARRRGNHRRPALPALRPERACSGRDRAARSLQRCQSPGRRRCPHRRRFKADRTARRRRLDHPGRPPARAGLTARRLWSLRLRQDADPGGAGGLAASSPGADPHRTHRP